MELGGCADRWVDVFVTKQTDDPVNGQEYAFDDDFVETVQSVEFDPNVGTSRAFITENDSPWIMVTWIHDNAGINNAAFMQLQVGDLVRIGGIHTSGFTDYLTVVEIVDGVQSVQNACSTAVKITSDQAKNTPGEHLLNVPTVSTETYNGYNANASTVVNTFYDLANNIPGVIAQPSARRAVRLNANINATKLPNYIPVFDAATQQDNLVRQEANKNNNVTTAFATLETRDHAYEYVRQSSTTNEKYYYPLYKAKNWVHGTVLNAKLDHGVKQVAAVKLLGYSLVNKRAVGIQHAHEMQGDDYLIVRIKEIDGRVISNNQYAHGAFAVLRVGDSSHRIEGATEFSAYEPSGIVCVPVHQSNATLRNLTIEVTDRLGQPAHFGRFHLWFKLLVTHG